MMTRQLKNLLTYQTLFIFFGCNLILARPLILPIDSIKPGMKGVGYSVFSGTKPEKFNVEIIDVMRRVSPRGDIILARLSGAGLEQSGVIAGMSGSPVYINNRVVGAVAYAWPFAKEPIAGITPAAEMLKIWELPDSGTGAEITPARPEERSAFNPVPVPIAISGFNQRLKAVITPILARYGLTPIAGGIASGKFDTADFVPGGVVGVALIDGDVRAAAIGTITHREGNRILGFGHPMFLAGAVRLPMTGGKIHTVLPSMEISAKMFSPSNPIGTITQDRSCGISGVLGGQAPMIPVTVQLHSATTQDSFHFRVVDHEQLFPDFLPIGLISTILESEGVMEEYALESEINLYFNRPSKDSIQIRHLFSGTEPLTDLMDKTNSELKLLFANPIEKVKLKAVRADFKFTPGRKIAQLLSARAEQTLVKPGETLTIVFRLRDYRGEETQNRVRIQIPPATPPGVITINITSRDEFLSRELGQQDNTTLPKTLDYILDLLAQSGREDELVIAGYVAKPGLKLNQSELFQTPPSIRRVLFSNRSIGEVQPIGASRVFKTILPTERVIVGSVALEVEVK